MGASPLPSRTLTTTPAFTVRRFTTIEFASRVNKAALRTQNPAAELSIDLAAGDQP